MAPVRSSAKAEAYAAEAAGAELELLGTVVEDSTSLLLLGPREPGFWPAFSTSPEYADGKPDPIDRWSKRVIGALAKAWGGEALFPSDGPPYPPFIAWALASGQVWASPVTLLIHARQGLWLSFRGAVRVPGKVALPAASNPCDACVGQPCRTACPVNALTADGYDVASCKAFLDQPEGESCRFEGCAVRRACPVSQAYGRLAEQSQFHMRAFHPT
jgi:epoxyqueuosine reductase